MDWHFAEVLNFFRKSDERGCLLDALHGLEKESLRSDRDGSLAFTTHPKALGNSFADAHITTDFSESQLEFITSPFRKIEAAVASLEKMHRFVYQNLGNELLWPMSMPCKLPSEQKIPIAYYGESEEAKRREIYRRGLALRYGRYMQMLCGVHYNVSFSSKMWELLKGYTHFSGNVRDFSNEACLHLARNFIRYRWILTLFFGASPFHDKSFPSPLSSSSSLSSKKEAAISLRLSKAGYSNPLKIPVSYNSFSDHVNDLKRAVKTSYPPYTRLGLEKNGERLQLNDHMLQLGNEYYFPIRLKPSIPYDDILDALNNNGVEYIEIRVFDLNPFDAIGVNAKQFHFTYLLLLYCLFKESPFIDDQALAICSENQERVALKGRDFSVLLKDIDDKKQTEISIFDAAKKLLNDLQPLAKLLDESSNEPQELYESLLYSYHQALENPSSLPAFRIVEEMKQSQQNFLTFGLQKANEYAQKFRLNLKK